MSKVGRITFVLEFLFMFALIQYIPIYWKHSVKLIIIYMIIQWVFGHYGNRALLIWEGIKWNIQSHAVFFIICIMATPTYFLTIHEILVTTILTILGFLFSLTVDRYVRIWFRDSLKINTLIIGVGKTAAALKSVCKRNRYSLIDVKGFIDCNDEPIFNNINQNVEVKDNVYSFDKIDDIIEEKQIESIFIAIPELESKDMSILLEHIRNKVNMIKYLPQTEGLITFDTKVQDFDGVLVISTASGTMKFSQRFWKRLIDIIGALVGMVVLFPLTIYVWIKTRLSGDNNPILFTQNRIGKNGEIFKIYKFRTMIPDAENVLEELMRKDPKIREEYLQNKKLVNDPRITKAGKMLREKSLDEFPQFINVLKGEMSLIGPRPYLEREIDDMGEYYSSVVACKPGLTGMWQTHGRSDVSFKERLELDEYYYRNWSIWLDLTLLVKTIQQVLNGSSSAI